MRGFVVIFLAFAMACGQQLPSWLIPYPGAKVVNHTALASRTEVAYTSDASSKEVLAYYQRLFTAAGLPFLPSFDGIGTSIRAAAAECDLLITVREQEAGALTRVSCSTKSANSASAVVVTGSNHPRTMEDRIRQGQEETRRVLAEADAQHKKRIDGMKAYDQPVDARARKKQTEK